MIDIYMRLTSSFFLLSQFIILNCIIIVVNSGGGVDCYNNNRRKKERRDDDDEEEYLLATMSTIIMKNIEEYCSAFLSSSGMTPRSSDGNIRFAHIASHSLKLSVKWVILTL